MGALVTAIASAVIAAVSACFAFLAYRRSGEANRLSKEANLLSSEASRQTAEFFEQSGPKVRVTVSAQPSERGTDGGESCLIRVTNVGRMPAIVQEIRLELQWQGEIRAFPTNELSMPVPFELDPTEVEELAVSGYFLAWLSQSYGRTEKWRAIALIGDGDQTPSQFVAVVHPVQPSFDEAMTTFNRRLHEIMLMLNAPTLSPADIDIVETQFEALDADFPTIRARYESLGNFRVDSHIVMFVNGERLLGEVRAQLATARGRDLL